MSQKIALTFCSICILSLCFVTLGNVFEPLMDADETYFEDKFALNDVVMSSFPWKSRYEDEDEDNGGPSSEFRPMGHDWEGEINRHYFYKRGVDTDCLERKREVAGDRLLPRSCAQKRRISCKDTSCDEKVRKCSRENLKRSQFTRRY